MATVVGSYDMVACFCEGHDHVPELIGGLGEAVDEEDSAFGGGGGGEAFGVEDADFRVGLLDPGLAVAGFRGGGGCHCCGWCEGGNWVEGAESIPVEVAVLMPPGSPDL